MNTPVTEKECIASDMAWSISKGDLEGNIIYASENLCRMSGYTLAELMGQPHSIFRHSDVPSSIFADMWETIQAGQEWQGILKNRYKNGDFAWSSSNIFPMYNEQQECIGYMNIRRPASPEQIAEAEAHYGEQAS